MLATSGRSWFLAALIALTTSAGAGAATKINYVSPQISPAAPGSTNSATVQVKNSGVGAKTVHVITSVPGYGGIKCEAPVWLPPRSSVRWPVPMMLPPARGQKLYALSIAAALRGQRDTKRGNQFLQEQSMRTAVVEGNQPGGAVNVASAMRRQIGLSSVMTYLTTRRFPLTVPALLPIEQIYFDSLHSRLSGPQIQSLRDWVLAGGRLWIDLGNAAGRQLAQAVLGHQYDLAYVQTIRSAAYNYAAHGREHIVNTPHSQRLRCYFTGHSKVIVSADDWPVIMRYRMGRGQVWLNAMQWQALVNHKGDAIAAIWPATRRFFGPSMASTVATSALDMAANAIGYRVASRQSIIVILGVLILVVTIGGWALGRRGKGGLLGALALGAALVASGALFAFGRLERGPVPLSESAIQVASLSAHGCFIKGQAAIFAPQQTSESAHVSGATATRWNKFIDRQRNCRFDYSPSQQAITVRHLTIPSGKVVNVAYESFQNGSKAPVNVSVIINRNGFAGSIQSRYELNHPIIAGPSGILGLKSVGQKKNKMMFTAGASQVLPGGQYMPGVLLTRKNQREESLMAAELQSHPARSPELLAWSRNVPPAWSVQNVGLRLCSTLMILPLDLHLPLTGHAVDIPWPMVRLQIVRGPGGQMSAPVYNLNRHRWIAHMTISGHVYMQFSVPRVLQNIHATRAHISFSVAAPGRLVSLAIRDGHSWVPVVTLSGGRGIIDKSLRLAPGQYHQGHILLRMKVGMPAVPDASWHFVYGRVSIHGKAE